ncbi:MAG TPA: M48 family metallopeptidase [Phnomibacter sp.]|nr:M48 family metallopeptidase [Phnomibacter sp.]
MSSKFFTTVACTSMLLAGCAYNAATGKRQLSLVSNEQLIQQANTQYKQFLISNKVVRNTPDARRVQAIGSNISQAITRYYASQGKQDLLKGYKWEFNLIQSNEVNAWCMPGGKIVVYTGILPVAQTDDALAVIMGHEIAHAIAEHSKERVSAQLLQQGGALALGAATAGQAAQNQNAWLTAYGAATTLGGILPFSRKQELEADKLGLIYAAYAGYNPQAAIGLWQRMAALNGGQRPPAFASTHPAEADRIKQLELLMPEAMEWYRKSGKAK